MLELDHVYPLPPYGTSFSEYAGQDQGGDNAGHLYQSTDQFDGSNSYYYNMWTDQAGSSPASLGGFNYAGHTDNTGSGGVYDDVAHHLATGSQGDSNGVNFRFTDQADETDIYWYDSTIIGGVFRYTRHQARNWVDAYHASSTVGNSDAGFTVLSTDSDDAGGDETTFTFSHEFGIGPGPPFWSDNYTTVGSGTSSGLTTISSIATDGWTFYTSTEKTYSVSANVISTTAALTTSAVDTTTSTTTYTSFNSTYQAWTWTVFEDVNVYTYWTQYLPEVNLTREDQLYAFKNDAGIGGPFLMDMLYAKADGEVDYLPTVTVGVAVAIVLDHDDTGFSYLPQGISGAPDRTLTVLAAGGTGSYPYTSYYINGSIPMGSVSGTNGYYDDPFQSAGDAIGKFVTYFGDSVHGAARINIDPQILSATADAGMLFTWPGRNGDAYQTYLSTGPSTYQQAGGTTAIDVFLRSFYSETPENSLVEWDYKGSTQSYLDQSFIFLGRAHFTNQAVQLYRTLDFGGFERIPHLSSNDYIGAGITADRSMPWDGVWRGFLSAVGSHQVQVPYQFTYYNAGSFIDSSTDNSNVTTYYYSWGTDTIPQSDASTAGTNIENIPLYMTAVTQITSTATTYNSDVFTLTYTTTVTSSTVVDSFVNHFQFIGDQRSVQTRLTSAYTTGTTAYTFNFGGFTFTDTFATSWNKLHLGPVGGHKEFDGQDTLALMGWWYVTYFTNTQTDYLLDTLFFDSPGQVEIDSSQKWSIEEASVVSVLNQFVGGGSPNIILGDAFPPLSAEKFVR